jgi:phage-related minor tail protein
MSIAAPVFSAAGYKVEDAALLMGVMANNGIEASVAANSLKTGFARLVSPTDEASSVMADLGITMTDANGQMKDTTTIQRELHDAFANLSEAQQIEAAATIFGKNQMAPWLALINAAPEDVEDLSGSLENCAGTTDEMAEAMMGGFGGSIEQLKSSIDVLVTSLGEALAPTIQKVVNFVQGLTNKFNRLTPAQQKVIAKIGMFAAAAGPVILVISKIIGGIGGLLMNFSKITGAVSAVAGAFPAIGTAVSGVISVITGPIGIVVAAIAGITAVVVTLWKTNEDFRNGVINIWNGIKDFLSGIWQTITGICSGEIAVG